MTKYQREKQALSDAANKADEVADKAVDKGQSLLTKLKDSKYTAWGLIAGAATVIALILK